MAQPSQQQPQSPGGVASRSAEELDREPGSNRGTRGQTRESRKVARSAEDDIQTMAGHDDPNEPDRTEK